MATTAAQQTPGYRPLATSRWSGMADRVFRAATALFGLLVVVIIIWIGQRLFPLSALARGNDRGSSRDDQHALRRADPFDHVPAIYHLLLARGDTPGSIQSNRGIARARRDQVGDDTLGHPSGSAVGDNRRSHARAGQSHRRDHG